MRRAICYPSPPLLLFTTHLNAPWPGERWCRREGVSGHAFLPPPPLKFPFPYRCGPHVTQPTHRYTLSLSLTLTSHQALYVCIHVFTLALGIGWRPLPSPPILACPSLPSTPKTFPPTPTLPLCPPPLPPP
eukprot:Sspe_Gene.55732::Locus_30654_Transcript_1_1_Confidence_1.000_Length_559::g.55732::m.55732